MASVAVFDFNLYHENTYIIYDDTGKCIIMDPGMYEEAERKVLDTYISKHNLSPQRLINTHCHIDHVLGNKYVSEKYGLDLEINEIEIPLLNEVPNYGLQFGLMPEPSPQPKYFLEDGDIVSFGDTQLKALFTPGHSPGHLCFYSEKDGFLIGGDVLFHLSIGRTDLPGGDFATLERSIREKLYVLPDDTIVYPGHGQSTTIGFEKKHNPFVNAV